MYNFLQIMNLIINNIYPKIIKIIIMKKILIMKMIIIKTKLPKKKKMKKYFIIWIV